MIKGLDFLGLGSRHWNVRETLAGFPQGFALGLFADETFGNLAAKNARVFLDSGKVSALRAQLHWSYTHELVPMDKLKKLAKQWEQIARLYQIPFYLSHSCEYSNRNKAEIKKRVNMVQDLAPTCFVVQTPMHSPVVQGGIIEVHGSKAKAKPGEIVSADGSSLPDINSAAWMAKNSLASIVFGWGFRFNLAKGGPPIPAPQRTASPDRNYIRAIVRTMEPKEAPPLHQPPGEVVEVKDPLLYKVLAEDTGDKRGNRPLIMLRKETPSVEVCTISGKSIGKFVYFAPYPNSTFRFYSGLPGGMNLYGWQIAERLKAESGTEWGYIKQGKKFFLVHFAFRSGYYQD